jgi:O-succinylbenzoic acid--CoA ligase
MGGAGMTRAEFAARLGGGVSGARIPEAVVISEANPVVWRQKFVQAAAGTGPVFLANPDWGSDERAEFNRIVEAPSTRWDSERGWLMIPTGGSTGGVKLARHDQHTMAAAVDGFTGHFGLLQVEAIGVLPMHHVGGLMGWLRSALTGGTFRDVDWKQLLAVGHGPPVGERAVISLVPTQLSRLLNEGMGRSWLQQFFLVLMGGGALTEELAAQARAAGIRCALGYGMTETMAMVTALKPEEFLAGCKDAGGSLPHADVEIAEDGRIQISSSSLFRGYWPDAREDGAWLTSDRGEIGEGGRLRVLGRMDDIIISGGEKIDAVEVERVLGRHLSGTRIAVVGMPDSRWGQRVVACYVANETSFEVEAIEAMLHGKLA